ncbi:MAG: RNB domain-containing ribonuclease [Candidatus Accumulibacter sp.]|jgi:exoribonuclease-2|nr:RNB domain-containing ribonuclease [Accumulibacter sp.]
MYVLFEEEGAFRAGTILTSGEASLQVETVSGKRSKVKLANVLLRYEAPAPGVLLALAEKMAADIETDFLWECAGDDEFSFHDFANEYFGGAGHESSAVEATALLLALHAAPVHFHRKGKGRFRKAPPDILAAALAGLEKKRQQALTIERMTGELAARTLPPEFAPMLDQLIYQPDRNRPETRALEAACARTGLSAQRLLVECGAIRSAYGYHYGRFLREQFPRGVGFPELEAPAVSGILADSQWPRADAHAFSIDDAATTEIDDAFSLTTLPGVGWRVGIHIAAPGLVFPPNSPLDQVARTRLSTVYMPGAKITMLPEAVIDGCTLAEGRDCPVMSLYLTVTPRFEISAFESCIEVVPVVANLRHHRIEPLFNAKTLAAGLPEFPFRDELETLWRLACACRDRRGKPAAQGGNDYDFVIAGDLADPEACQVTISERRRGSPLDTLVSELMIVTNATWGGLLADRGIPAIYRAQTAGKVRMTTSPLPHEGLGVDRYAWSSSPLRRYVDLVNQWQLIACLRGEAPPFPPRSELLFAAMRDFDLAYSAYAEFQRGMERYWCLRWLRQERVETVEATVRRENLVKLNCLPVFLRVPSMPELNPGQRVRLAIGSMDLLALELDCRYLETLGDAGNGVGDEVVEEAVD